MNATGRFWDLLPLGDTERQVSANQAHSQDKNRNPLRHEMIGSPDMPTCWVHNTLGPNMWYVSRSDQKEVFFALSGKSPHITPFSAAMAGFEDRVSVLRSHPWDTSGCHSEVIQLIGLFCAPGRDASSEATLFITTLRPNRNIPQAAWQVAVPIAVQAHSPPRGGKTHTMLSDCSASSIRRLPWRQYGER